MNRLTSETAAAIVLKEQNGPARGQDGILIAIVVQIDKQSAVCRLKKI